MIVTEAEARTKWCPLVRLPPYSDGTGGATNRPHGVEGMFDTGSTCIGSACMAWAWTSYPSKGRPDEQLGGCGLAANLGVVGS